MRRAARLATQEDSCTAMGASTIGNGGGRTSPRPVARCISVLAALILVGLLPMMAVQLRLTSHRRGRSVDGGSTGKSKSVRDITHIVPRHEVGGKGNTASAGSSRILRWRRLNAGTKQQEFWKGENDDVSGADALRDVVCRRFKRPLQLFLPSWKTGSGGGEDADRGSKHGSEHDDEDDNNSSWLAWLADREEGAASSGSDDHVDVGKGSKGGRTPATGGSQEVVEFIVAAPSLAALNGAEPLRGVLFVAHGCGHSATDFCTPANCPGCRGLPQERRLVAHAVKQGLLVVAVTASSPSRCWKVGRKLSTSRDLRRVVSVLQLIASRSLRAVGRDNATTATKASITLPAGRSSSVRKPVGARPSEEGGGGGVFNSILLDLPLPVPVSAMGASSGGAFVPLLAPGGGLAPSTTRGSPTDTKDDGQRAPATDVLVPSGLFTFSGAISQIMAPGSVLDRANAGKCDMLPRRLVLSHMTRDGSTARAVAATKAAVQRHCRQAVEVKEIKHVPIALDDHFFVSMALGLNERDASWMHNSTTTTKKKNTKTTTATQPEPEANTAPRADITAAAAVAWSASLVQALVAAGLIDGETRTMQHDPRRHQWRTEVIRGLVHGTPFENLRPDKSGISEMLNVAYGFHEFTAERMDEALNFVLQGY